MKTWEGEGEAMSEIRKLNLDTKILAESLPRLVRKERQWKFWHRSLLAQILSLPPRGILRGRVKTLEEFHEAPT